MSCITLINTNVFLITIIGFGNVLQDNFPLFFLHRKSKAKLRNHYQYPDTQKGDVDAFSREPFVVHFQAPKTGKNKQGKLRW